MLAVSVAAALGLALGRGRLRRAGVTLTFLDRGHLRV